MTAAPRPRRGGRRPGESGTREAILAAARSAFAELGYDRATIRGIAAGAAVDPALVLHYFGCKEATVRGRARDPDRAGRGPRRAAAASPDRIGETVVRAFLEAWEPPENRQRLVAMVRSAMTNEVALGMVREYLGRRVFGPVTRSSASPTRSCAPTSWAPSSSASR